MKKLKILLLAFLVMAVPLLAFASTTHAGDFRNGANILIGKDETIDRTLFVTGTNIEINGTINGDLFCAAQNVTVNGKVNGDVICAGMNLRIDGTVTGDVRAAAQTITLAGTIEQNASLAGSTITTQERARVGGDLQAAASMVTLGGAIARDSDVTADTLTLNGTVGRNVQAAVNSLALENDARIDGTINYYSNRELTRNGTAQVGGEVTRHDPLDESRSQQAANPVGNFLMSFLMLLMAAFVLLALFPRLLRNVSDNGFKAPGKTVLFGLVACIVAPFVIILSFLTVAGVLLGIVLLLAWIVILLLSGVFFSYYLGRLVFSRSSQHPFVMMLVGVALLSVLMVIPIVNTITVIVTGIFGSGMVLQELFARTPKPSYEAVDIDTKKTPKKK